MNPIRHISSSIVRSESHNTIELTPWDLRVLQSGYIQHGLLFQKSAEQKDGNQIISLIQNLKASLSHTLNIFYPLAGRLALIQNDQDDTTFYSICINCNDQGAQFIHAAAEAVSVADILDPQVYIRDDAAVINNLFPMNFVQNCEGISKPLLAVQVTDLVDGIFIACSINHVAVDGTSSWHFLNTWSQITRSASASGVNKASHSLITLSTPVFDRKFLDGVIDLPIHIPSSCIEKMTSMTNEQQYIQPSPISLPPMRIFHFPKEKVANLKAKANAEMGMDNKISSLQALTSHIWRATIRSCRHDLSPDQGVCFFIPVGVRQRLWKPEIAKEYFGTALGGVFVKSTVDELLQKGVGYTALHLHEAIHSLTVEKMTNYLKGWAKNPMFPSTLKANNAVSNTATLSMGGSHRFDVYGNDFGWGRPLAVRSGASNRKNGKFTVYPGAEEGSLEYHACLSPETLSAMEEDSEFMEAL